MCWSTDIVLWWEAIQFYKSLSKVFFILFQLKEITNFVQFLSFYSGLRLLFAPRYFLSLPQFYNPHHPIISSVCLLHAKHCVLYIVYIKYGTKG